jgi:hypothetical protein
MCNRTMKIKKGAILQEVNSNTNSIELTVKGLDTKSFNYKKQSHVNSNGMTVEEWVNHMSKTTKKNDNK